MVVNGVPKGITEWMNPSVVVGIVRATLAEDYCGFNNDMRLCARNLVGAEVAIEGVHRTAPPNGTMAASISSRLRRMNRLPIL